MKRLELPGTKVAEFPLELTDEAKARLAESLAAIREAERQAILNAHTVFIQ